MATIPSILALFSCSASARNFQSRDQQIRTHMLCDCPLSSKVHHVAVLHDMGSETNCWLCIRSGRHDAKPLF